MSLFIHKHTGSYINYGLNNSEVDLKTVWQTYQIEFVTSGFSQPVTDARLRFWLAPYDSNGDKYWIDNVVLVKVDP